LGTARLKLREILDSARLRGTDQVPLSNIKRLFRSLYQMELSETALGHSKLTELLQDTCFNDICVVQLQDRGYAVVPAYLDQTTSMNDGVALGTETPQTPRSETEKQERLNASAGTPQQEHDCNWQTPVRAKVVPPLMLTPSPPRMIRRAFTMPNEFGIGKETSNEHLNSLDSVFSHRSLTDSKCSTARDLNGESNNGGYGGLRVFSRMDSSISEGSGWTSPQRGAGAELRARLQRRLCKAEGLV